MLQLGRFRPSHDRLVSVRRGFWRWLRFALTGVGFGVLAGGGLFVHLAPELVAGAPSWFGALLIGMTGAGIHVTVRQLRAGIVVSLVGFVVAMLVAMGTYALPTLLVGYSRPVFEILFPIFIGQASAGVFLVLPIGYYGGYLAALTADAYLLQ